MSLQQALFFAISGIRRTKRTELFEELRRQLPQLLEEQAFAFFPDPFGGLPHPLLWSAEEAALDPTSRLFECWAVLNEFTTKQLRPALQAHDVVVVDGFGLNALLYATACFACPDPKEPDFSAVEMHHAIVRGRVISQGIGAPEYFVTQADPVAMTAYLRSLNPKLTELQCRTFLAKEARMIRDYFGEGTGQRGALLPHELSIPEMVANVVGAIRSRIEERRRTRAA